MTIALSEHQTDQIEAALRRLDPDDQYAVRVCLSAVLSRRDATAIDDDALTALVRGLRRRAHVLAREQDQVAVQS